jgi:hypothetical protein
MPKSEKTIQLTFLEFVIKRHLGEPAHRGSNYACWPCPFHNDHHPSFYTRPHKEQYKDRWKCHGCGEWGDEKDFLRLYHPKEDYNARLERLRKLRAEYDAMNKAVTSHPRGSGSPAGVIILWALFRAKKIDHYDLLDVVAELNHRHSLAMELKRLCRNGGRQPKAS